MKKALLSIMLIALLLCSGCESALSEQYKVIVSQSRVNVGELLKRCRDGDGVACEQGLEQAYITLVRLEDAMNGERSVDEHE